MRIGVAAQIADRNLAVFAHAAHDLREFTAAFFGERGQRNADHVARRGRVETEVGIADRLFHDLDHVLFPGLDRQRAGVAHTDLRHLVERRRAAVVVHLDLVEQARRGAARTDLHEFFAGVLHRRLHLVFGLSNDFRNGHVETPKLYFLNFIAPETLPECRSIGKTPEREGFRLKGSPILHENRPAVDARAVLSRVFPV